MTVQSLPGSGAMRQSAARQVLAERRGFGGPNFWKFRTQASPYLFLLPYFLVTAVFFVYPLIYAAALAGLCIAAAGAWRRLDKARFAAAGIAMAWAAFAAAAFDYVENLGLDISLWWDPASPWPQISAAAATLKFSAIALCVLYASSGAVAALIGARGLSRA